MFEQIHFSCDLHDRNYTNVCCALEGLDQSSYVGIFGSVLLRWWCRSINFRVCYNLDFDLMYLLPLVALIYFLLLRDIGLVFCYS